MSIVLDGSNVNTVGVPNLGTAQASTSGTSITFTGIPSGTKRITLMLYGVSTSGTANLRFQLGSGSITSTGYLGACVQTGPSMSSGNSTSGFDSVGDGGASYSRNGFLVFTLISANIWIVNGVYNLGAGQSYLYTFAGSVSLSGALDRVVITTTNGTDTFDAGSVNIQYE